MNRSKTSTSARLSRGDTRKYLEVRYPRSETVFNLAGELFRLSEGNPLFMVQICEQWRRRNIVRQQDSGSAVAPYAQRAMSSVPKTIRHLINKLVDELGEDARSRRPRH